VSKAVFFLLIVLASLTVTILPAQTATEYQVERGNWTVWTTGEGCALSPKGIQLTPYNSIQINSDKSGDFVLYAAFWPGAFEMSSQHSLEIEYDDKKVLDVAAEAISTSTLKTSRPVKISHLYQLAIAKQIFIRTRMVQDPLFFSMADFGAAFDALERCVEILKQEG
jgi:hypothetical protein